MQARALASLSPRSGERVPRRDSGKAGEGLMRAPQPKVFDKAHRLRRNLTDAERKLWFELRDRRLCGFKFVRQEPIGPCIADFVCRERGLVIEVDGGQHAESSQDAVRDKFLRGEGYRILRIWNKDMLQNREGVILAIPKELGRSEDAPHAARS